MPPKQKFVEGEKVLCYHGPLIYEAKCLKSSVTKDKQVKYFVHYAGWSKSWDEWVPESRVLKYNEANVAIQKEVQKNAPVKGKKTKAKGKTDLNSSKVSDSRASTPVLDATPEGKKAPKTKTSTPLHSNKSEGAPTPEPKKKRTKIESTVESGEEFVSKVEVHIKIPEELKQLLVDDWDVISRQRKLWTLPASPSVDEILDSYVTHVKGATSSRTACGTNSSITEIANGIKEHFNTILHTQLLYRLERQQYYDLMEDDDAQSLSAIYGGIHLLRLFVRIGDNLAFTVLDENNIQYLVGHIQDLLKYLLKNSSSILNTEENYTPTPEYYKKVG